MIFFCLLLGHVFFQVGLIAHMRVDFLPALLREQCKFSVTDPPVAVRVHVAEQFLYVFKADLKAEEVDGLCPLVEGNGLGVVGVYVSESLAQVPEPLTDLERD